MNAISRLLLKAFINHKIKRFGKMTTLQIDPATKKIELIADLAGETEPLTVRADYLIERTPEGVFFSPSNVVTSREWMTELATQFLRNQPLRVPVPGGLPAMALKVLGL